jgi:hypothetical protein
VDDALIVRRLQALADLHRDVESFLKWQWACGNLLLERLPFEAMARKVRSATSSISYTVQMLG